MEIEGNNMRFLQIFRNSITAKVISLVSLLAIMVFVLLIAINSYWQRKDIINQIQYMGYRTTDLIELNIEEPMLLGDNMGTHDQFSRIDNLYDDLTVYLTDFQGNITYSTRTDVIRKDMDEVYFDENILDAMDNTLKNKTQKSSLVQLDEGSFFMTVRSVANQTECYHCHGRSHPILGSMLVMQNADSYLALLQMHQLQNMLLGLGCLGLLIFTLIYFLKRTIINRITLLHDMGNKITKGNLDAEFKDLGQDELGKLAQGFEIMVNNLKKKIKEAKDKSQLAEEQANETRQAIDELVKTQHKLIQTERFAAIGEAASHLSHEIKNPLMIMAGFARQAQKSLPQDCPEQEKLSIIVQEAQRLEKMLYEVRDFTRPRKVKKEPCEINKVITDTIKIFDNELKASKVDYKLDFEPNLPEVNIDKDQIKQVLINLIKNSLEAMPDGGLLTVASLSEDRSVRIQVQDTGQGIPLDKMKSIFSPFFTTKDKGTGLGLAVTYKIIQDHGGDISVDSKPGHGAKFTFTIPIYQDMNKQNK
jgi:signal transduction histidine kinase